jgi:hypothetical protein
VVAAEDRLEADPNAVLWGAGEGPKPPA